MHIAIFGSGGVGGYFGGRLVQAGYQVTFIARGLHLKAMRTRSLQVKSIVGDFELTDIQATDNPAEIGRVDAVIMATKAWQVPAAAEMMHPLIGPETTVVPLQNGVEAPGDLIEILGEKPVLGGLCRIISYVDSPGTIKHGAGSPYIAFGELNNQPSDRVEQLRQAFAQCEGLTVEVPSDIQVAMWIKFMLIATWSGIGALTRVPVGIWLDMPETREMWIKAMNEVVTVANAHQIALNDAHVEHAINFVSNLHPTATASMQRDIMAGRHSELNSLGGAIVRLGLESGIETPINSFIYHTLLPQEMSARTH